MITTLFLLLLLGFQLWYMTAKKADNIVQPAFLQMIVENRGVARMIGGGLILLATILFIVRLGMMSGLSASTVGLMGVGCLVVLLRPFRYISGKVFFMLYAVFVILEIVI